MDSLDEGSGRLDEQLGVVRKILNLSALVFITRSIFIFTFCFIFSSFSGKIIAAAQCYSLPALYLLVGRGYQV